MAGVYGPNLSWGDHVIVIGLQQTGKSTLARALVKGARRVVYVDPKGDYAREIRKADVRTPLELEQVDGDARYMRLVVLVGRGEHDAADEVRYVARKVREWSQGSAAHGIVLVMDELHLYSDSASLTLRGLLANGHGIAPEYGGIVTVLVSQRGVDIPLGCRALVSRAYALAQEHERDLERLEDEFGPDFAAVAKSWEPGDAPAYWERRKFWRK